MQNLKSDNHCLGITTQSGKATNNPPMSAVDEDRNDVVYVDEAAKEESKKFVTSRNSSQKLTSVDKSFEKDK